MKEEIGIKDDPDYYKYKHDYFKYSKDDLHYADGGGGGEGGGGGDPAMSNGEDDTLPSGASVEGESNNTSSVESDLTQSMLMGMPNGGGITSASSITNCRSSSSSSSSSSSTSSSVPSSGSGGMRTSSPLNTLQIGPGGPPLTSTHVQQLSSLCPPFPEAHLTSLNSPKEDPDKSKYIFLYFNIRKTIIII